MTVTGKSNHSGNTAVNGGELCLKSGATLGTGALTVARGATLSGVTGNNALTNASYNFTAGSTLQVGATATAISGTINFGGKNVTLATNSTLKVGATRCATSTTTGGTFIQNIGTLTINATIEVTVPENNSFAVGDSIILWKDVTNLKGTPTLTTFYIAPGLFWDDSDLAQGILRVTEVAPVGVRDLTDEELASRESKNNQYFDLQGRPVTHPRRGQTYLVGGRKVLVK